MHGVIAVCVFMEFDDEDEQNFSTGWIRFPLAQSDRSDQFTIPNVLNRDHRMILTWSPKWLGSQIEYRDINYYVMAFPQFTWKMDGDVRDFWHPFATGSMHVQYAGKWSDL